MKKKFFVKGEYINNFTNKLKIYLLYTTDFQLNLLCGSTHIYVDGTFKSVPDNWYQLLTIHCTNNLIKKTINVVFILINSKSSLYYNIFIN